VPTIQEEMFEPLPPLSPGSSVSLLLHEVAYNVIADTNINAKRPNKYFFMI
jgi:hypothetical protein